MMTLHYYFYYQLVDLVQHGQQSENDLPDYKISHAQNIATGSKLCNVPWLTGYVIAKQ
jgi:hypothetical protein